MVWFFKNTNIAIFLFRRLCWWSSNTPSVKVNYNIAITPSSNMTHHHYLQDLLLYLPPCHRLQNCKVRTESFSTSESQNNTSLGLNSVLRHLGKDQNQLSWFLRWTLWYHLIVNHDENLFYYFWKNKLATFLQR